MRVLKNGGAKYWFKMLMLYSAFIYAQSYQVMAFTAFKAPTGASEAIEASKATRSDEVSTKTGDRVQLAAMQVEIGQKVHLFDGAYLCEMEARLPHLAAIAGQTAGTPSN